MTKITVIKKTGNFTILDNTCLKDENLSWKGRGLLVYLLHLPNDWQIYLEDLDDGTVFSIGKRVFQKESKRKLRYLCVELKTNKKYLINATATVNKL